MKKPHNIVITGIQPWDIEIGSNCKSLALEFSKKHNVIFINPPIDRSTILKNWKDKRVKERIDTILFKKSNIERINSNLSVFTPRCVLESINWLPSRLFSIMNKLNNKRFANEIKSCLSYLNINNFILFTDSDMFRSSELKTLLKPSTFIYYSRDNLMTVPYWRKHGNKMEPEIIKKADFVFTNSEHLRIKALKHNVNSYFIGQGCDIEAYLDNSDLKKPFDLQNIKTPIIGYTGLLSSRRLSIKTIEHISKTFPNFSIVLVGPEEDCFKNSNLHELKNIYFLGTKTPEELPAYINAFDVCINPQTLNELTKSNYPRKIDEYLASGKATVATYTPTMELFKDHCYLAKSDSQFTRLIQQSIEENNKTLRSLRIKFAMTHTWENCVNLIISTISNNHLSHV